jgi:hypothetical protein
MKRVRSRIPFWSPVLIIAAMFALGSTSALAQDATPGPATEPAHPAHIHDGTCDTLGDVVYPLNDIATYTISSSFTFGPAATPEAGAAATPMPSVSVTQMRPVLYSFTHIDAEVVDLVGGSYAVNAHESAENIQNYIACGNIPQCTASDCQMVTGVVVELMPLNNSGYFGVARIDAAELGGSNVSVFLFHLDLPSSG